MPQAARVNPIRQPRIPLAPGDAALYLGDSPGAPP